MEVIKQHSISSHLPVKLVLETKKEILKGSSEERMYKICYPALLTLPAWLGWAETAMLVQYGRYCRNIEKD